MDPSQESHQKITPGPPHSTHHDRRLGKRKKGLERLEERVGWLQKEERELVRRVESGRRREELWGAVIKVVYFVGLAWGLAGIILFVSFFYTK